LPDVCCPVYGEKKIEMLLLNISSVFLRKETSVHLTLWWLYFMPHLLSVMNTAANAIISLSALPQVNVMIANLVILSAPEFQVQAGHPSLLCFHRAVSRFLFTQSCRSDLIVWTVCSPVAPACCRQPCFLNYLLKNLTSVQSDVETSHSLITFH
jgi:hypothetical protein